MTVRKRPFQCWDLSDDEGGEENDPGFFTDMIVRSELCPFGGLAQQYSSGGQHCFYVECSFIITQFFADAEVTESSDFSSQGNTETEEVPNPNCLPVDPLSYPSPYQLFPHILLPSNRRIFWSASRPGVMRARHYIAHHFAIIELQKMGRYKDESPAVRVYTVCDESRYLIVRNVPALGCGDDLMRLFTTYGEVEECKPMDAEDCEEFTDVYWIKFRLITNARFAKRKLDESAFLGNRLQISYAPEFESLSDTNDKLETRRKEVLARLNPQKEKRTSQVTKLAGQALTQTDNFSPQRREMEYQFHRGNAPITRVSSNQEYFASSSMNQTVQTVREKLNKIEESGNHKRLQPSSQTQPHLKRTRVDNRRRI